MQPEEIEALMSEPACAHNQKSKSDWAKPAPAGPLSVIAVSGMARGLDGTGQGVQSAGGDLECPVVRGQRIAVKLAGRIFNAIGKEIMQRTDRPLTVVPVMA